MNKTELIAAVAEKTDLSKKDADAAVSAVLGAITDALKAGDKIQLVGFGTFEVRNRAAKQGRNPRTGETMTVPASKVPAFKAGKALKDAVAFPFFRRANGYSSICLPRKDAATATSLRSVSEGREPSEFKSSTTQPETSPLPIIG